MGAAMKTFLIAAVAVAVSGAAFAKDLKGSVMTDSEMDKVTAGSVSPNSGLGLGTAVSVGGNLGQASPNFPAGNGRCTASIHQGGGC